MKLDNTLNVLGYIIWISHQLKVLIYFYFFRVISIKNYHPKIRIITQMLQYHNKVTWQPTVFLPRVFCYIAFTHTHFFCLHWFFFSEQKCPNKPYHLIQLQGNSVLFIFVRDIIKILWHSLIAWGLILKATMSIAAVDSRWAFNHLASLSIAHLRATQDELIASRQAIWS